MALPPRPIRALPAEPAQDTESGLSTSLVARIVIVATVVLGQLFALTVALEASLVDHDLEAWLLAGFSVVSFAVVLLLMRIEPPKRAGRLRGRARTAGAAYVPTPVEDPVERERPDGAG